MIASWLSTRWPRLATLPLTLTRPSAIHTSTSRREPTPRRARTFCNFPRPVRGDSLGYRSSGHLPWLATNRRARIIRASSDKAPSPGGNPDNPARPGRVHPPRHPEAPVHDIPPFSGAKLALFYGDHLVVYKRDENPAFPSRLLTFPAAAVRAWRRLPNAPCANSRKSSPSAWKNLVSNGSDSIRAPAAARPSPTSWRAWRTASSRPSASATKDNTGD